MVNDEPTAERSGAGPSASGVAAAGHEMEKDSQFSYGLKAMFYAIAGLGYGGGRRSSDLGHDDPATIERVNERAAELDLERAGLRLWRAVIVVSLGGVPIAFILLVPLWGGGSIHSAHWILGACLTYLEVFLLILLLFVRARVATVNAELKILAYDVVLTTFEHTAEKRAANLFFKHQAELKQYYDQTLRQNRQAFVLGVVCVAFGLGAVLAVATLILAYPTATTPARLAAGGLGILSALLTGFVASIYMRVYEGSAEALGTFHDRLVSTNHYHFANLLISSIQPEAERMRATSEIAGILAAAQATTPSKD